MPQSSATVLARRAQPSSASETHLSGWPLMAARALVFGVLSITTALFVVALAGSVAYLSTPCQDAVDNCLMTPEQVTSLARLGITPTALAVAGVALSCLLVLVVYAVVAVLLWRRSDDWMALLVALALLLAPQNITPIMLDLRVTPGLWQAPVTVLGVASSLTLLFLVALFPSGRFVPRWLWVVMVVLVIFGSPLADLIPGPEDLGALLVLAPLLFLGGAQFYRYRRVSSPVQRQQTKWVVFGLILCVLVNQAYWQLYVFFPSLQRPDSLYPLLAYPDDFVVGIILMTSFSVAILRYRLWDIDTIINKTLVYGFLTGLLGALYAALILGLEALAGAVNNATTDEPVALVVSTLIIAALFQPARRRIQRVIDQRFYRKKYDAEKALAAFSAALRNEVDLEQVRAHLLGVVQETMQPAQASLWLRLPARRDEASLRGLGSTANE